MSTSRQICDTCLRFPWHNAPAEDAGGQQHHPTRRELEISASKCPVCTLVLRAAVANYTNSRGVRNGRGYWRQHNCISYKDAAGLHQMNVVKELGACVPFAQITPSKDKSQTIITGVPTQDLMVMAPGYRNGQTVLMPTGPVRPDGTIGAASPDQDAVVDLERETLDMPVWVYGNWWCHRDSRKAGLHPHLMGVGARFGRTASPWDAVNTKPGKVHLRGSNIRLRTNDGSHFEHIPGRIPEKDSSSTAAFSRLQRWLDDCVASHTVCSQGNSTSTLPSRVLDVSSRSFVRLIDGKGEEAPYVTLSHTWGNSRHIETTKVNLAEHRRGIITSDLPPTFQDAIIITRNLGFRYLWIDALCIVQDDEKDRQQQTLQMGDIYRNARIMISAAGSSDSYGGCFPLKAKRPVASPAARSMGYNTPAASESHSIGFLTGPGAPSMVHLSEEWLPGSSGALPQFSNIGAFGRYWDPIAEEPLSRRGWALQERLLARRTVHYASSQMWFECQCGLQSEDGYHIPPMLFNMDKIVEAERTSWSEYAQSESKRASFTRGIKKPNNGPRRQGGWLSLVEDYSGRQLTEKSDKLVAIAGAARLISQASGDAYLAGCWRSHLLEDLFWEVTGEPNEVLKEGTHFIAPSWSWASVDGPVRFRQLQQEQLVAQVVACSTTPATEDTFGAVKAGEIEIMAPMYEIQMSDTSQHGDNSPASITLSKKDEKGAVKKYQGTFLPDTTSKAPSPPYAIFTDHLHAIVIQAAEVGPGAEAGPVLTSEDVRNRSENDLPNWRWRCQQTFTRIGVAQFSPEVLEEEEEDRGARAGSHALSEDEVSNLTLGESERGSAPSGPVSKDDTRVCVCIG